uniref:Conserved plasma membrane protein n=1 Tax=Rhabditophanes sp. KR3021 TaxID=114890 RepID=A0AC35U0I5_9BILA
MSFTEYFYKISDFSTEAYKQLPDLKGWLKPKPHATSACINTTVNYSDLMPRLYPNILRIAGISGAAAIALSAYGAHAVMKDTNMDELSKKQYDTASKYHLIHTVALLGATQAKNPKLTGSLFIIGMLLFCGPLYHSAITRDKALVPITPYGGFMLIFGWLSFLV